MTPHIARMEAAYKRRHRILDRKLAGESLAAIAKDEGVERSRIQQLIRKAEQERAQEV